MTELMDIYDENKNKINKTIDRKERYSLSEGEYTISVHCFIINSNNQILLTKRNLSKKHGGKWEDTHGGLRAGESSIEGIVRELKEEIGLVVDPQEIKFIKTIKKSKKFNEIFVLCKDVSVNSLCYSDGEVIDCKYVSLPELQEMIKNDECTFKDFKETIFYNSNEIIGKLISSLDLGIIIGEPERVFGGLINRMYKVSTTTGIYAIKQLNPEIMKRKGAKENHIFAEMVANFSKNNGIDCIPAKIFKNGALQEIDGVYFLIYDWFNGKAICTDEITMDHIAKVATLLSKIHNTDFGDLAKKCTSIQEVKEIDWDFYIEKLENKEIKHLLTNNKEVLAQLDKKSTQCFLKIKDNVVISHRDLDLPNILWNAENQPVIIDWESAGKVNPAEEVIQTAWDWSGGLESFDIEKFKLFIKTYETNGGNLKDFQEAIYSSFKNNSDWLEFNLKRACKIDCFDEEEQQIGEREAIKVINDIILFYEIMNKYYE